jgi:hypothetical protein
VSRLTLPGAAAAEAATRRELTRAVGIAVALASGAPGAGAPELAEHLYASWYALGVADEIPSAPASLPPTLAEMLRAAHAGSRRWEPGWVAERVGAAGRVVARRGTEVRLLDRPDYVGIDRLGLLPRPGDALVVSGRHDIVDIGGGWWRTAAAGWRWHTPPPGLVRLYWHAGVEGLPALVGGLTAELADEGDPWLLKCALAPAVHARADATVAYLTLDTVRRRANALVGLAPRALRAGGDRRPPLTLMVAPGLAAAFDPGGGESFGEHRCRLVAETVIAGHARGEPPTVEDVVRRFAMDGVEGGRPWGRSDDPRLPWEP